MKRKSQFAWSLAVAVLLGSLISTTALARTFTDLKGRTIEADVVSATGAEVTIKRADGKEFTVALNTFTVADQEYVKQWLKEKAKAGAPGAPKAAGEGEGEGEAAAEGDGSDSPEEAVEETVEEATEATEATEAEDGPPAKEITTLRLGYRVKKEKTASRSAGKGKSEDMCQYIVEMDNLSNDPIGGVTAKYEVFIRYYDKHAEKKRGVARTETGELKLKPIGPRGKSSFNTKPVRIITDKSRTLSGDLVTSYQYEEDLDGMLITFFQGERKIGEYAFGRTKRD